MRIIDRYIFKELIISFIMGLVVFTFVLLLNSIFQLVDLLINKNVSIITILQLLFYLSLTLVTLTVPIALLFSIIITYSKFSQNNEITIYRSSGLNTLCFIWQPLILSIIFGTVLCYMNFFLIPKVQHAFNAIHRNIIQKQDVVKFDDKTFIQIANYRIYINKVDKKEDMLAGVNIYKFSKTLTTRIFAKKGKVRHARGKGFIFTLYDGILQNTPCDEFSKLTQFTFKTYRIVIPVATKSQITRTKTLREFTAKEILDEIETYRSKGLPITYLETEYFLRWILSFVVLSFCILGVPLGIKVRRGGKSIGIGLTLVIITIYYFSLIGSIILSEKAILPARYIMWSSNILIFIPGLVLNIKMFRT